MRMYRCNYMVAETLSKLTFATSLFQPMCLPPGVEHIVQNQLLPTVFHYFRLFIDVAPPLPAPENSRKLGNVCEYAQHSNRFCLNGLTTYSNYGPLVQNSLGLTLADHWFDDLSLRIVLLPTRECHETATKMDRTRNELKPRTIAGNNLLSLPISSYFCGRNMYVGSSAQSDKLKSEGETVKLHPS